MHGFLHKTKKATQLGASCVYHKDEDGDREDGV